MIDNIPHIDIFRLESKTGRYALLYTVGLVFGVISLYFYVDIILRLKNYYTLVLVIPLYAILFGESTAWLRRGIRIVEIDSSGLTIHRARDQEPTRIEIHQMGDVQIGRSMDGTVVTILLKGASSRRFLWMTFYSGPRIQIKEQMFDKQDFSELVRRITVMKVTLEPATSRA